ncbi:unnamed protein product [Cuscuta europaea]|uniref:Uncharacterized protein n=1 Tax=Cuscuta europaea TaxID=41803 RepID=A0A9P1E593_CUSEU|nr:unnamed protein product [Cuscuta europaea]
MADRQADVDYLFAALKSAIRQPPPAASCIDVDDTEEDEEEEDDYDEDDEYRRIDDDYGQAELACPFCSDDYDVLGLCCHIDSEHRVEIKSGICPFCASNEGMSMAAHVISQHENILRALAKKKLQNNRVHSGISSLRKELQNLNLHHHLKEFSRSDSSSNAGAGGDSMMLSFVNNQQSSGRVETTPVKKTDQTSLLETSEEKIICERGGQVASRMDKKQEEKLQRCEFVHEILLSTMLDDFL